MTPTANTSTAPTVVTVRNLRKTYAHRDTEVIALEGKNSPVDCFSTRQESNLITFPAKDKAL